MKNKVNPENLYGDSVMVKLYAENEELISIKTCDAKHGVQGRFLLMRGKFESWMNMGMEGFFCDQDCENILIASRDGTNVHFCMKWISPDNIPGEFHGNEQEFEVPVDEIRELLQSGKPIRFLHKDDRVPNARIHLSADAQKSVAEILKVKAKRAAFIKAMRDCFKWRDSTIELYRDYPDSFYFEEFRAGKRALNGGLILHEWKNPKEKGGGIQLHYSVHT